MKLPLHPNFIAIYFVFRPFILFFAYFGDGNWRQTEAWNFCLAGAVEVNALAQ